MPRIILVLLAVACAFVTPAASAETGKKKTASPPAAAVRAVNSAMRLTIVERETDCGTACPQWIAAQGEITADTPALFAKVLSQTGKRKLPVILNSTGGSIPAALEIGELIHKNELDVAVGITTLTGCTAADPVCKDAVKKGGVYTGNAASKSAFCNSACHLILAGGKQRLVPKGSSVGVHQARTVWTREIITFREKFRIVKGKRQVIARWILSREPTQPKVRYGYDKPLRKTLTVYYKKMGVDPAVLAEADKASFKQINFLSAAELDRLRLRTSGEGLPALVGKSRCTKQTMSTNCLPRRPAIILRWLAARSAQPAHP